MNRQKSKVNGVDGSSDLLIKRTRLLKNLNYQCILKKCWFFFSTGIIISALCFTLFKALTPWARQYKAQIENHLSLILGHPVQISSMETGWYWFEPVLKLNQVTVSDAHQPVLKLDKLLVGINLLSSLWHWQIQPGILHVDDLHLSLRQEGRQWHIDGLGLNQQAFSWEDNSGLIIWLLTQKKIRISNFSALVHLEDGTLLPVEKLDLTVINQSGHYRIKGSAKLNQTIPTQLFLLADLYLNGTDLNRSKGEIYMAFDNFLPAQWQGLLPRGAYHVLGGQGDLELWLDIHQGHLAGLQSQLNFNHIAWSDKNRLRSHFIQSFNANLAWKPDADGWQLTGDRINLKTSGTQWPENTLRITYRPSEDAYNFYIKSLCLAPLLKLDIPLPESMVPLSQLNPVGQLHDTQIGITNSQLQYVLTRFSNLGWNSHDETAGLSNLSGVLNWQPEEGHLEIDAKNAAVTFNQLPPISLTQINGVLDWKKLSNGVRMSIDRLIMVGPDLVFSANGIIDKALTDPYLQLEVKYALENAEKWLTYIPASHLKPKLDDWLKNDIKKIKTASGHIRVIGDWSDFPFDKQEGTFSVISHLSGVDLYPNDQWPITKNIDAHLTVNQRTLEADITHAELSDLIVDDLNLRIDDIGYDRETLLMHALVNAPVDKIMAYVLSSPLKERLSKLKQLELTGPVALNLGLEIPLYPEKNVLAHGSLLFHENDATFHHAVSDFKLNALTGNLQFDQQRVLASSLSGKLLNDPVEIQIQSIREKTPYTEVKISGNTTIDLLKSKFDFPLLNFLNGRFEMESRLKITDDPNDLDHFSFFTTMEGVAVNLPPPFEKPADKNTPLNLTIDFNTEKGMRLKFNYDKRLSGNVWFDSKKDLLTLSHGEIRLGSGLAVQSRKKGLQLVGSVSRFDVNQWMDIFNKLPADKDSSLMGRIGFIDLEFESAKIANKNFKDIILKASRANPQDWSLQLKQAGFSANLLYQKNENLLSGHCEFLHLPEFVTDKEHNDSNLLSFEPGDIPNLNLTVDDLQVGRLRLGKVILKSKSFKTRWQLNYCKLLSPDYQMTIKGEWIKHDKQNNTKVEGELKIDNLEKSLLQWDITPVIEAHQGEVYFKGGWSGPVNNFSLAKLDGGLHILLRNGRITNLSPETEEKIGLGKLLSILSLQTIPRRLTLDFSDLANGGYSFDVFKGNFLLKHGSMKTTDSYIDGPVAHASIKGELDLANQLYNLDLHVSPHITASLPVVATIAGGPIAGIATWVASKIINHGMQKISGYTYKVTGPWLDPIVQQVSIIKKKS